MDEQLRQELLNLSTRFAAMDEKLKAAFHRIDEQKTLAESVHKLALAMEKMTHEQGNLRADVDAIQAKTAKRWETVTVEIIKALVLAALGAVLVKVGMK